MAAAARTTVTDRHGEQDDHPRRPERKMTLAQAKAAFQTLVERLDDEDEVGRFASWIRTLFPSDQEGEEDDDEDEDEADDEEDEDEGGE